MYSKITQTSTRFDYNYSEKDVKQLKNPLERNRKPARSQLKQQQQKKKKTDEDEIKR